MATSGSITPNSVISAYKTLILDRVNNLPKWTSVTVPTGNPNTLEYSSPVPITGELVATTIVAPEIDISGIVGTITLSAIENLIRTNAAILSKVRQINLIKTYRTYETRDEIFNQTNYANMNASYVPVFGANSMPPMSYGTISGVNFDTYMSDLSNVVDSYINTVLVFTEAYCHSNCHSNHSSRSRR